MSWALPQSSTVGVAGREGNQARLTDADDREARRLMLRVGRGEVRAFEAIFRRYHMPLFNFFLRLARDREVAEDGVQETFLRLWKAAARYHPASAFRTYLFQIGKNWWWNEREKRQRRSAASLDQGDEETQALRNRLPADGDEPYEQVIANERRQLALDAIDELDEKHRIVVLLAHFHGFRYREIAEILEIPEGTVKTRMFHAERKLRDALRRRHLGPPPTEAYRESSA